MKQNNHLPQFVLDCSITMAWCFEDEVTPYAENIMDKLADAIALVPALWSIEVANVLIMAEKKKRISPSTANAFRFMLGKLPIRIEENIPRFYLEHIFKTAKENHLTAYDAAYLDLALQHNLPIATLDKDLQKAAKTQGIEILHA
ncbi:MAG: type II toxin-antitoxin system VapC family toxin [Gammaproteobacteria bacterium]|nr:type II toxin-antitoxin system VapC family toxin [Gammaproteobacteria bacterium]